MDGIHDLGGKHGYGPIEVDDGDYGFHHDWEGREWGIAQCARTPGITIDWWRHCRELIQPEDYLQRPYFDSWAQTDLATYLEADWFTREELSDACSGLLGSDLSQVPPAMSLSEVLESNRTKAIRFDAEVSALPAFSVGQKVKTNRDGHTGHTRLPQYARGRLGCIHAHHGAHVFPDLSARGGKTHQHLYSVMFLASDLWGEVVGSKDTVYLDLWESYLNEIEA